MLPPANYKSVDHGSHRLLIKLCYCKYNGKGIKNQRDYLNRSLTDDQCSSIWSYTEDLSAGGGRVEQPIFADGGAVHARAHCKVLAGIELPDHRSLGVQSDNSPTICSSIKRPVAAYAR
jgi:hypothetical protein